MYRALTLEMIRRQIDASDIETIAGLSKEIDISFQGALPQQRLILNGEDVSEEIRSQKVDMLVSAVSAIPQVRDEMLKQQRQMSEKQNVVLDGRDIGTVVFPNADLKIFLVANLEERARRRWLEMRDLTPGLTIEAVKEMLAHRDKLDSSRESAPLMMADDAIKLDTTALTIAEQTEKIILYIMENKKIKKGERMTDGVNETLTSNPRKSVSETYKNGTDGLENIRIIKVGDILENEAEISADENLMDMYSKTLNRFNAEDCVTGHVIRVGDREVVVDVGLKSEGIIPIDEFGARLPEIGSEIEVYIDKMEDDHGQLILSKRKADFLKAWEKIRNDYSNNKTVEGYIVKRIKGGMVVDLYGVEGFLPGSQIDVRPITDFDSYVGKTMPFKIVKLNEVRKNIVVSHKEIIEEQNKEDREKLLSQIKVKQVIPGRVKNITDFGAFIDLGGLDGLLHITDMSWGKINHPSEMLNIDQVVDVMIIDYDIEKQRVSLGMKQLTPNPWDNIEERYPKDAVVKGKVVSITNYGLFVELEKGVEGLIHISELSWTQNIKHPSEVYRLGSTVEAKVLSVDMQERKISLGVKQLLPDPWTDILKRYPIGSQVKGTVRTIKQYGAFVELETGIDGLVHISDLSWTQKIRHPKDMLHTGDEVNVAVLDINTGERKISLGLKQLEDDPWLAMREKYKPGSMAKGTVIKVLDKGVIIKLPEENFEAIVPLHEVSKRDRKNYIRNIRPGSEIELRVDDINDEERKVILTRDDLLLNEEEKEIAKVIASQEIASQKIEGLEGLRAQLSSDEQNKEPEEEEEA
ncbi:MAG TPA: (d)CMP kinase [Candidatus Marinimicrobia bacterium]|nr:(d)CMP kinase [Candidatus Neomarinimicrobiota bacterium]